tara:strand:+ start:386 stop:595 length:210 start_codon:yes stop_codon:yes gene_type:complete
MNNFTLSNQAIGAIMMALQKSLMDQTDIVPVLQDFEIQLTDNNQLVVTNPPVVEMKENTTSSEIETSVQ